ncbi:hypothetical protein WJX82_010708 [Trebouxia sp. C0006]
MAPQLPIRNVGRQGLKASVQGLGCMGMSMAYKDLSSTVTDEDSIATIHRALELGVTFLDTSDVYGPFTHEELVGKAIKGNREKYMIATKFGNKLQPNGPMAQPNMCMKPVRHR